MSKKPVCAILKKSGNCTPSKKCVLKDKIFWVSDEHMEEKEWIRQPTVIAGELLQEEECEPTCRLSSMCIQIKSENENKCSQCQNSFDIDSILVQMQTKTFGFLQIEIQDKATKTCLDQKRDFFSTLFNHIAEGKTRFTCLNIINYPDIHQNLGFLNMVRNKSSSLNEIQLDKMNPFVYEIAYKGKVKSVSCSDFKLPTKQMFSWEPHDKVLEDIARSLTASNSGKNTRVEKIDSSTFPEPSEEMLKERIQDKQNLIVGTKTGVV